MQPDPRIVSLVSIGRHPASSRPRRADQDSRAVELGMRLSAGNHRVIHAGDSQQQALRSYAGMGLASIGVLEVSEQADATLPLLEYLEESCPDIVLTGTRAESGESSGMTPYILAEKLGWPIVPRIADIIAVENGAAKVLQALPRGQRRSIEVSLPFIASVDSSAPEPRQSAYGPARRAEIEVQKVLSTLDDERSQWRTMPARKRPKRLKQVKARTAAERFKAATAKSQNEGGRVIRDKPASEQARAIFDLLIKESALK